MAIKHFLCIYAGSVNSVAYTPDGQHVVSGSSDKTICIWSTATWECKAELSGSESEYLSFCNDVASVKCMSAILPLHMLLVLIQRAEKYAYWCCSSRTN